MAESVDSDAALQGRLRAVVDEGWELWERFDLEVRGRGWHPFVAADYDRVLEALLAVRAPGARFLEWGSATGVVTILADLLGFEAWGIELDGALVRTARELAARHRSAARFAEGSFIPTGYRWRPPAGGAVRTLGTGESAYPSIGRALDDFELVFAYPWGGEEAMMHDLMRRYGAPAARFLVHRPEGVQLYVGGRAAG